MASRTRKFHPLAALAILPLILSACEDTSKTSPPGNPDGLTFPVACTLGEDCWIARYVDHSQDDEARDYLCGNHTQSGHKGTDIALNDLGRMANGVDVLAAKGGTVLRVRDGVEDISVRRTGADAVDGQECGNGIVIAHDNGDESQYCHLKKGSITVEPEERVEAGAKIAQVGLSGETEFPHLHYMLRRGGEIIDPFDGSRMGDHCDASGPILWANDIAYDPLVLFDLQLSDTPPKGDSVWQAGKTSLSRMSPAMVVTARGMFTEAGDTWHMRIRDPKGKVFVEQKAALEDGDQFYYRFIGRKRPDGGFLPGIWTAELTAKRGTEAEKKLKLEFRVE